jgi:uncharacterized protein (TIGR02117 family)
MRSRSRKKRGYFFRLVLALTIPGLVYLAGALVLGLLPAEGVRADRRAGEYRFYACDNGVHVDLVLPVLGGGRDWRRIFPAADFSGDVAGLGFVSLGWGARRFYLETPSWAEFSPGPALLALFSLDDSVLHVAYGGDPFGQGNCVALVADETGRAGLFAYLDRSMGYTPGRPARREAQAGYGPFDAFYEATGTWSIFKTCNAWTADALEAAGQPTALWSPFSFQVMRWLSRSP